MAKWRSPILEVGSPASAQGLGGQLVPQTLLSRALHVLPWGLLIVSAQGRVTYYNQAYARLRGLPWGALLGHPVEQLDRRHRLGQLLHTGVLLPERHVPDDRRLHREFILPIREDRSLLGALVVVVPAAEWSEVDEAKLVAQAIAPTRRGGCNRPRR